MLFNNYQPISNLYLFGECSMVLKFVYKNVCLKGWLRNWSAP